jgi:hypothetical protein
VATVPSGRRGVGHVAGRSDIDEPDTDDEAASGDAGGGTRPIRPEDIALGLAQVERPAGVEKGGRALDLEQEVDTLQPIDRGGRAGDQIGR